MVHEVRFLPSGRRVRVERGTTLLEAARSAGLPVASSCGADGLCARCGMSIVEASCDLAVEGADERRVKQDNRVDTGLRLACRVAVECDLTVTASYW